MELAIAHKKNWWARAWSIMTNPKPLSSYVYRDVYNRKIPDAELIMYPPKHVGIPVFSLEAIMKRYGYYIEDIKKYAGIGDHRKTQDGKSLFNAMYVEPLKKFASFAHMLPASEDWHHTEPGGLLVHSIETSIMALRLAAQNKDNQVSKFGDIKRDAQERLLYAAWMTALTHDTGKMFTDIEVTALYGFDSDYKGRLTKHERLASELRYEIPVWRPEKESLLDWALRYRVTRYDVTFLPSRMNREHNRKSAHLLPLFLYGAGLDYILATSVDIHGAMIDSLNGYSERNDYLSQIIRKCDSESTRQDMEIHHSRYKGAYSVSIFSRAQKVINLAYPHWVYNDPKGHAWCVGQTVFLRWPLAGDSIIHTADKAGVKLTKSTDFLYQLLLECSIIKQFNNSERGVKFAPGEYEKSDIERIHKGDTLPEWQYMVEIRDWSALTRGGQLPRSMPGIIHMPKKDEYVLINKKGKVTNITGVEIDTRIESAGKKNTEHLAKLGSPITKEPQTNSQKKALKPSFGLSVENQTSRLSPKALLAGHPDIEGESTSLNVGGEQQGLLTGTQAPSTNKPDVKGEQASGNVLDSEGSELTSVTSPDNDTPDVEGEHDVEVKPFELNIKPIKVNTKASMYGFDAQAVAMELGVETETEAATRLKELGIPVLEVRNKPGYLVEIANIAGEQMLVINITPEYALELLGTNKKTNTAIESKPHELESADVKTEEGNQVATTKPSASPKSKPDSKAEVDVDNPQKPAIRNNKETKEVMSAEGVDVKSTGGNDIGVKPLPTTEREESTPSEAATETSPPPHSLGSMFPGESEAEPGANWIDVDVTTDDGVIMTLKHHCEGAPKFSFAYYVMATLCDEMVSGAVVLDTERKAVGIKQGAFSRTLMNNGTVNRMAHAPQIATRIFEGYEEGENSEWWFKGGYTYVPLRNVKEIIIGGFNV